jgi:hypothetical protein
MARRLNPFNELYLSETIRPDQFVKLFSPLLVDQVEELFLPGNVVLRGVQGSGKSMLLDLLKPEVRIAYYNARQDFPVKGHGGKFLGAGINLSTSRAIDFGQRLSISGADANESRLFPLYFADFVNYWVVHDLLRSIDTLCAGTDGTLAHDLGISRAPSRLAQFARAISQDPCWFGYLRDATTYEAIKARIRERISHYWSYLNFNSDFVPEAVATTKTQIGHPISRVTEALKDCEVLVGNLAVFIRVDQYEELFHLEGLQPELGAAYRAVVNKALGIRDDSVWYRFGTRRYAWKEPLEIFGTTAQLEQERNFKVVDLDMKLRRQENEPTLVFPRFAEDVFAKRAEFAGYTLGSSAKLLTHVFGPGLAPEEKARIYCKEATDRAIKTDQGWPEQWKAFLSSLAKEDPLSARLGEAWARQGNEKSSVMYGVPARPFPWDEKKYWRKERVQVALMQIAGRAGHRMIWEGKGDILSLSGGNILVFVSICQNVWEAWLRTVRDSDQSANDLPEIKPNEQAVGVYQASKIWFEKVSENMNGNRRQRLISWVGTLLERRLYNDLALSRPGENGFSIAIEELDTDRATTAFLEEAVDFGDLFDAAHTTKTKDRKPRRKWYLNPVLSPHFKLTHIHTKEPMYVSIEIVRKWLEAADQSALSANGHESSKQLPLFYSEGRPA